MQAFKRTISIKINQMSYLRAMALVTVLGVGMASANVKVAVVRSWGQVPVFTELNDNWAAYGTIPLTVDTSLHEVGSFTYQDLANTGADVLWLSDPAGGMEQYSDAEIDAVQQYVSEGHSILGTYAEFRFSDVDNRRLASIFGLRQDIEYNTQEISANSVFDILVDHPLFRDVPDPYVSSGYPCCQVPADDLRWDAGDFGTAQLLAQTDDGRGVITWYKTESYYAIYVSEMVEYQGNPTDTQFLYNALTIPEPGTILLVGLGGLVLARKLGA
jgi:hypothetical protein